MSIEKEFIKRIKEIFHQDKNFIPLHRPMFGNDEKEFISKVIDSTFVSSVGKEIIEFENTIKNYVNSKYAIATNSGTSALHAALLSLGVDSESEVITQSMTFVATLNAISYTGAKSILIDVDEDSMGMNPKILENFLLENTDIIDGKCVRRSSGKIIKACVPVHVFGMPCRINDIKKLCNKYKVALIEDSTESLGSKFENKDTGTFGDIGTFSFNGNKIITTGAGGMCVTDNEVHHKYINHITKTGKLDSNFEYIHDIPAYNYRMPNLNAALGITQFKKLDNYIKIKRKIAFEYQAIVEGLSGVRMQKEYTKEVFSNFWLNTLIFESKSDRDSFASLCSLNNIQSRFIWKPMHLLNIHRIDIYGDLKVTEKLYNCSLNIPSSSI